MMLGGSLAGFLADYSATSSAASPGSPRTPAAVTSEWNALLWGLGRRLLPILGLLCLAGVAVSVLQTGFLFLPQRLGLDFGRLSPSAGGGGSSPRPAWTQLGFGVLELIAGLGAWPGRSCISGAGPCWPLAALPPPALSTG